jgi:UDPglucose--hexose-1-phosphate uridylyltransferase
MADALRVDALTGATVAVAAHRQDRPNLPDTGCPFCVGGLEAPEPYTVKAFPNRWPSLPDGRCEVVLYSPDHDATFWSVGLEQATAVMDLWAARTTVLGRRDDVAYVLVGENRGPSVGATIAHPHGQIYAYPTVPDAPATELERAATHGCPLCAEVPGDRLVAEHDGWRAWVPHAAVHPYGLVLAPLEHEPDLPALGPASRRAMAACLAEVLGRLDHLWPGAPDRLMPSMLWIHQRPTDGRAWPEAHVHIEVAVPMRAPGVPRYVAAMELGSGQYVNPVVPEQAASDLRAVEVRW